MFTGGSLLPGHTVYHNTYIYNIPAGSVDEEEEGGETARRGQHAAQAPDSLHAKKI